MLAYPAVSCDAAALESAYAACERLARAHYENFPVASWLLPRRLRRHVAAVYAFARIADDFADEGDHPAADRQRHLDSWRARLRACVSSDVDARASGLTNPTLRPAHADSRDASHAALFMALGHTIRSCNLPPSLFDDLLNAFAQDITTHRYASWSDLLGYCRQSANPVGRLVLRIAGYDDPQLDRASDCVCSALQLANFWQDLDRDWQRGRLYVPAEDRQACDAPEADLDARRMTPAWRRALQRVSERTRAMFAEGRPVCDGVHGRLRFELRLTWLGGIRVLDRLAAADYDVFAARPTLGLADAVPILWHALSWKVIGTGMPEPGGGMAR